MKTLYRKLCNLRNKKLCNNFLTPFTRKRDCPKVYLQISNYLKTYFVQYWIGIIMIFTWRCHATCKKITKQSRFLSYVTYKSQNNKDISKQVSSWKSNCIILRWARRLLRVNIVIMLYVLVMSCTRFRVNPHSINLNFRFPTCFEQGVPWHSGNYRVWIHSESRTWHDKNIQSNVPNR